MSAVEETFREEERRSQWGPSHGTPPGFERVIGEKEMSLNASSSSPEPRTDSGHSGVPITASTNNIPADPNQSFFLTFEFGTGTAPIHSTPLCSSHRGTERHPRSMLSTFDLEVAPALPVAPEAPPGTKPWRRPGTWMTRAIIRPRSNARMTLALVRRQKEAPPPQVRTINKGQAVRSMWVVRGSHESETQSVRPKAPPG
ncbi:hypothetical protein F5148DRAFT_1152867 [Russula earlei]|uniref:Uncharacterized protein n=1 Tax=Russula earlei TaxID=71964 RepID=A0ACC0TV08_9AGAM|nr:hypothetical protein F5148DRAFT_1152867 [Russula earlei]